MEEEKNENKKEKKIMPVIWGLMILIIIVILVISNTKKNKQDNVAVDSDKVVQIETKNKEDEEIKTKTEVILSRNSIILSVGGSETLELTDNNKKKLSWNSSHPSIASVDDNGRVTAVSMGTAIITGEDEDGNKGNCTIIVKGGAVVSKKTSSSSSSDTNKVTNPTQSSNNNNEPSQSGNTNNNSNNSTQPNEPINPDEPMEVIKCIVTFMVDGKLYTTKEIEEGKEIGELPINPNKYGYTFGGWYSGERIIDSKTIVTENIIIEARWDTYTFELALINGDEVSPNRIVRAYKNGQSVNIKELCGTIGDNTNYTLATWNEKLNAVKCVSAKQIEHASNYMIILNNAAVAVYANEE